jgi:hypothetical protein
MPKMGGSSVHWALKDYYEKDTFDFVDEASGNPYINGSDVATEPTSQFKKRWGWDKHCELGGICKHLKKRNIDIQEYKFIIPIRNPWDWLASWYFVHTKVFISPRGHKPFTKKTWKDFFNEGIHKGMRSPESLRVKILENPHNVNVVYVRVDNMQEDLQSAVDEYGIKIKIEPKNVNVEKSKHPYWYYYDQWPESIKIVEKFYKEYIDKFKWTYKD